MALSYNDLQTKPWSVITGATDNDILSGAACRIMAIEIRHTAAANIGIDDAATHAADDFNIGIGAAGHKFVSFAPGGYPIRTGLSVVLSAGTAWIFYVLE